LFGVDENSNGRYLKYFVDNSNVSTYSDWIRLGVTNCIAKNLPTEFSVDKVTINGVTRYMLVHQRIFFSYDAVVRASESLGYWPDDVRGQNVWIGDLRAYDRDLTGDKYIWALKGHTELAKACDSAMADFTAPSCHDCMLISYYSQQLGRLRFICFPLYKIAPWCPALDCAKASLLARRSPE